MQYGDKLESDGRCLPELLGMSMEDLSSQFRMKRGHIARFMGRTSACLDPLPTPSALSTTKIISGRSSDSLQKSFLSVNTKKVQTMTKGPVKRTTSDMSLEQSVADLKIKDEYIFKGIVAAQPADSRLCGCIQPPPVVDKVAPYPAIEGIAIQKLTPEYKYGMEGLVRTKAPPMKASDLWRDRPAVLLCIRRPG